MHLEPHEKKDGFRAWLSEDETDLLLSETDETDHRIAFALGAKCGLRSQEIVDVTPQDVSGGPVGPMLTVPSGKGDKYRETPIPDGLKGRIETVADYRSEPDPEPLIDASTRTLQRWIESKREELRVETGDPDWSHVTMHDLRRTWATRLAEEIDNDTYVMMWGGWERHETFQRHYRGAYSPEAQARARDEVSWL